jgi:hypothetical protein
MKRRAALDSRAGRIFVSSWSQTVGTYGAYVQGDWIEAVDETIDNLTLGGLVRSALAASRDGVPFPDFRKGPTPERQRLLKLAGVKSETQYARGMRTVSVGVDEPGPDVMITPYRNGGRREGFTEMLDKVIMLDAGADDAALGAAVRRGLSDATDAL